MRQVSFRTRLGSVKVAAHGVCVRSRLLPRAGSFSIDIMIKFLCPNGHPLSAPENLAGKPGKCPKCNTPFVVPPPEDAESLAADELASLSSSSLATPSAGSGKNLAGGETFMFLCPNGHKLNGPPSLKGKAGQCPHCGARFRIPTDDEIEGGDELGLAEDAGDAERIDFNRLFGGDAGSQSPASLPPGGAGMGIIFGRLWQQRTEETELELFLTEGEILVPDYYSELLSRSDFGVFAIQEGDGSYAITVVPWSSVRRVSMRRIADLPSDMQ
jgi:hypothetical protein